MKVVLSANARLDLTGIGDFIARDSRSRARSFVQELRRACLALSSNALRYAFLDGYAHKGFRRRPLGNYLIIYMVQGETVTIVRVLNAAQNLAWLLDDSRDD